MDPVNASSLSETILTSTKIEIPTSCEQTITLTKMEIVDAQPEVDMDNSNSQHLVGTQYINLHRVSDLTKTLSGDSIPAELLSHHVVDLGSNPDYSQHVVTNAQFYDNADFLSQSFSEEERRLALVAVQLIQNRTDSPSADGLGTELLHGKTTLPSVSSISGDKTVMSTIVSNYVQTVDPASRHQDLGLHMVSHSQVTEQHIVKGSGQQDDQMVKLYQPLLQQDKVEVLTPLEEMSNSLPSGNAQYVSDESNGNSTTLKIDSDFNTGENTTRQIPEPLNQEIKTECSVVGELNSADTDEQIPVEGYEAEADVDARSSQKSLPHKKRIPSKLKKALTAAPTRNIHAKCYKCTKCGEQFPTQSTFNSHKLQHSSKKSPYACELCNKTCQNQLKFFEHLKSHYEPGMNPETIGILPEHVELPQQFEETEDRQTQEQCETDQQMTECRETEYETEQIPHFTCGKCGRVFRRQKAFDCHMSISHPKQEEIEEFSEPEDMMEGIRHVVNMVPTGDEEDKNFEPWDAPKSIENVVIPQQVVRDDLSTSTVATKASDTLKVLQIKKEEPDLVEEEQVNTKQRKEMQCPHCERTFVHRNSLLYHIRSHTGHRPHQCELCGKSFFAAGALKIHHRLHSGDKPYKCEYCGRFFRQWGDLKYHITSLHSNTKMFQCEYCGKDFARKYSLVVHRRIHTGEKNYICEYCTKTFRAASYLQNHRRIHTGEKPHMCQVCGKPFRVRSDMKRHMKTHPDSTNVLSDLSNNTGENNVPEVREMCLINNQDMSVEKQDDTNNATLSDQEVEQNLKPVISETGAPLNLNVRPGSAQEELYDYQREDLVDRENTGTLYVWIQTNTDSILPDA